MKTKLLLMTLVCTFQIGLCQTPPFGNTRYKGAIVDNRMFQDCERNIYSLNDLMADKPLIIFQSTVDCGYCFEEAPDVSNMINQYRNKINFAFFLTSHNTYPRCSGSGAGDHDWPDDWRNRYPGYKNIPIAISGTDYFLLHCEVTTSFGVLDPRTNAIIDGGCRHGGQENALKAALKLIEDGVYTSFATSVAKPVISSSGSGNSRTISISTNTPDAEIFYTTDGSTPSKTSKKYTGSFQIGTGKLIKAIASKSNMNISPVTITFVDIQNTNFTEIGKDGVAYEWTGLTNYSSNSNRKAFPATNDDKMDNANLNNGTNDIDNAYEAVGIIWDQPKSISTLKLTHHSTSNSNIYAYRFLGYGMKLQSTQDGTTWTDVKNMAHFPEYPYGSAQVSMNTDPMLFFGDNPITARGVRIIGQVSIRGVNWGGSIARFWGIKELDVFADNITSLNSATETSSVQIYPNPANQKVNIILPAGVNSAIVDFKDITGKIAQSTEIEANSGNEISISNLQKGIYIVQIKANGYNQFKQLVVE